MVFFNWKFRDKNIQKCYIFLHMKEEINTFDLWNILVYMDSYLKILSENHLHWFLVCHTVGIYEHGLTYLLSATWNEMDFTGPNLA